MTKKTSTQALPYVSSVTSNLKSTDGEPWTMELGQRTLIVGSNTSHKSSIIQSVELALTGAADDVVGRNGVKDASLLLSMAPGDVLTSTVSFSDDGMADATFRAERTGNKAQRPVHSSPADAVRVLPHRLVREALGAGEKKARKAFLSWVADGVTMEDVLAHIPADLHSRYKDIEEKLRRGGTAVDGLLATADYAGKQQRDAAKEAKGATSAMAAMGDGFEERPADQTIEALQVAVGAAQGSYDTAIRSNQSQQYVAPPTAPVRSAADMEQQYDQLSDDASGIVTRIDQIAEELGSLLSTGRVAEDGARILQWAIDNSIDSCPVCSSQVGASHIATCLDHWQGRRDAEESRIEDVVETLREESEVAQQRLAQAQYQLRELSAAITTARQAPSAPSHQAPAVIESQYTVEEARLLLETAQQEFSDALHARTQWDSLSALRDKVAAMHADVDAYKGLKAATEGAVGALLAEQTARFSKKVGAFLPKDWCFGIELKEGDKEVFRMGLRRGDKLHCALSGAEWSAVAIAISMATSSVKKEPQVLIPEDRAWDGKTLAAVMRGYTKFNGQVLMASTVKPKGVAPKGWTIIDMDKVNKTSSSTDPGDDEVEVLVIEKDEVPAEPGPGVSVRSARVLKGMGFEAEVIGRMSSQTGAELIRQGLVPHQITLLKSGDFRVVKRDNVFPLSPGK